MSILDLKQLAFTVHHAAQFCDRAATVSRMKKDYAEYDAYLYAANHLHWAYRNVCFVIIAKTEDAPK